MYNFIVFLSNLSLISCHLPTHVSSCAADEVQSKSVALRLHLPAAMYEKCGSADDEIGARSLPTSVACTVVIGTSTFVEPVNGKCGTAEVCDWPVARVNQSRSSNALSFPDTRPDTPLVLEVTFDGRDIQVVLCETWQRIYALNLCVFPVTNQNDIRLRHRERPRPYSAACTLAYCV